MPIQLIIVLGFYAVCWQGYKLRWRLNGLGHAALIAAMVGILGPSLLARLNEAHALGRLPYHLFELAANLLVTLACVSIYVFRVAADPSLPQADRRRRITAALGSGVAMAVFLAVLDAVILARGEPLMYTPASLSKSLPALYFTVAGFYWGVLLFPAACWLWRSGDGKDRHYAAGLRVGSCALFTMSALCIGRAIPVVVVATGGPKVLAPTILLPLVSAVSWALFIAGLSYPLIVARIRALRVTHHRLHGYERLAPLWHLATTAYPEAVLAPRAPATAPDIRSRRTSVRFAYERRRAECYDALCRLRGGSASQGQTGPARDATDALLAVIRGYDESHAGRRSAWQILDTGVAGSPETEERLLLDLSAIVELMLRDSVTNSASV